LSNTLSTSLAYGSWNKSALLPDQPHQKIGRQIIRSRGGSDFWADQATEVSPVIGLMYRNTPRLRRGA
jgi:hypothetical protein